MDRVELLTVERTFWLDQNRVQMLTLSPDLPIPDGWDTAGWSERTEPVSVLRPDGSCIESTAQINMTHLGISDPHVPAAARWHISVWLTDATQDDVPVGSKILVAEEVRSAVLGFGAQPSHPNDG